MLWNVNVNPTALLMSPVTRITLAQLATGAAGDLSQLPVPRELQEFPWLITAKLGGIESPQAARDVLGDFRTVIVGMRQQLRITVPESGGAYEDRPGTTADAFARNQLRIRATLRSDVVATQPQALVIMSGIQD